MGGAPIPKWDPIGFDPWPPVSRSTQQAYGFGDELAYKFERYGRMAWGAFQETFQALPYIAVCKEKFLATHGGISPEFVRACRGGDFKHCLTPEIGQMMVWSDPTEQRGWAPSRRGPGIKMYGADVTLDFLRTHGLKTIIRGHEQQMKGHNIMSLGGEYSVITVFSAADYTGLFCTRSDGLPQKRPPWDYVNMFTSPGQHNRGAILFGDHDGIDLNFATQTLSGAQSRQLAADLTHSHCGGSYARSRRSYLEQTSAPSSHPVAGTRTPVTADTETEAKLPMSKFFSLAEMEELQQRKAHGLGNESCPDLSASEAESHEQFIRTSLASGLSDPQALAFEMRKLLDLQGEGFVCSETPETERAEACNMAKKDKLTLAVYRELFGEKVGKGC
ncbi:unnamed protein product [Effrenium voratum]|nr:unnamed protein product [Effrenium voratum]